MESHKSKEVSGSEGGSGNGYGHMPESPDNMKKQLRRIKEARDKPVQSAFVNCDFIYGSAAEVERLWSICSNILTD